nr:hypothetical protein [Tanacetum cinerariifolium]
DWDTSAQQSESSSSITSSSDTEIVALKAEMAKINKNLMRVLQVNQQVKAVTPNCETCGSPHSFNDCPATVATLKTSLKAEMAKINKNLMRVLQVNQQVKAVTPNCETCGSPPSFNDCPATVATLKTCMMREPIKRVRHGQNPPPAYQAPTYQVSVYQAPVHQPQIPQPQVVTTNEFTNFMKANDAILQLVLRGQTKDLQFRIHPDFKIRSSATKLLTNERNVSKSLKI